MKGDTGGSSVSPPLAERMRPQDFSRFVGQDNLFKSNSSVIRRLEEGFLQSLILWGPPGTGKTSFARAALQKINGEAIEENAIDLGVKKIREIGHRGRRLKLEQQKQLLLFVDEIHRLNRGQQDVLLPFVEKGDLYLIGATTENPSYQLNSALMSRCRLIVFEPLDKDALTCMLQKAAENCGVLMEEILSEQAIDLLIEMAQGDGRKLLNQLEEVLVHRKQTSESAGPLSTEELIQLQGNQNLRYDSASDEHYDTISAFIKSIRGSDPNAAVYYLARMIEGGEDPLFIARRLVILASEDIGNADPQALGIANQVFRAVEIIGLPEAAINLAQGVTYLASAPKSNRSYEALNRAKDCVRRTGPLAIPKHLRSARTALMKSIGYGKGYQYSHNGPKGTTPKQTYLPPELKDEKFYEPSERGFEKRIREYLDWLKK